MRRNGNQTRRAGIRAAVTLRLALPVDRPALERLAQLDSRSLPDGPHLVAEREGRLDAALSLSTGVAIADPFQRTAELCDLLRRHATMLPVIGDSPTGAARIRPELAPA